MINKTNLNNKKKKEFSKVLLIQESILIWIMTISFIILAFHCITNQYFGELPWLTAMVSFPWGAYGISQACYYKKSEKENTEGGIKYASVMHEYHTNDDTMSNNSNEFVDNAQG